jgi:hypothetical protein
MWRRPPQKEQFSVPCRRFVFRKREFVTEYSDLRKPCHLLASLDIL